MEACERQNVRKEIAALQRKLTRDAIGQIRQLLPRDAMHEFGKRDCSQVHVLRSVVQHLSALKQQGRLYESGAAAVVGLAATSESACDLAREVMMCAHGMLVLEVDADSLVIRAVGAGAANFFRHSVFGEVAGVNLLHLVHDNDAPALRDAVAAARLASGKVPGDATLRALSLRFLYFYQTPRFQDGVEDEGGAGEGMAGGHLHPDLPFDSPFEADPLLEGFRECGETPPSRLLHLVSACMCLDISNFTRTHAPTRPCTHARVRTHTTQMAWAKMALHCHRAVATIAVTRKTPSL